MSKIKHIGFYEREKEKKKISRNLQRRARERFLNGTPPAGVAADYYLLERAYRGMNEENFTRL